MANIRSDAAEIMHAFAAGESINDVAARFDCARMTALRYRKMAKQRGLLPAACPCGGTFGHQGWCAEYERRHPEAQRRRSAAAKAQWRRKRRARISRVVKRINPAWRRRLLALASLG